MAWDQNFNQISKQFSQQNLRQYISRRSFKLWRWVFLAIVLLSYLAISGCVQYDVGVSFAGPHQGVLVQHIRFDEELSSFGSKQSRQWLSRIETRAKSLSGQIKRDSPQEITVQIPFTSGQELAEKFNAFFQPSQADNTRNQENLPDLDVRFDLQQSNLLLLQRNHLQLDVDLRSLGLVSPEGEVIINPGFLFQLEFSLEAPWGAKNNSKDNALIPLVSPDGHKLTWQLQAAKLNHLEAVFWLPSPIGLGAVVIILLMLAGFYLKYQQMPWAKIR